MLPKKNRLPIQDFVAKRASVRKNASFTVKTFPAALPYGRCGVIISKKVSPKATERNKIKRAVYAAVAPYVLPPAAARDMLIIVQKGAIIEELKSLL
jgi:ribonuclease P protein component